VVLHGRWTFYQDGEDRFWRWRCVDILTGVIYRSVPFSTFQECVNDARGVGFSITERPRVFVPITDPRDDPQPSEKTDG
jgi:hypothetical protein